VRIDRDEAIRIRLARAGARNAFDARMRDELCEALEFALAESGPVVLSGDGPAFSAGGDLDEFGRAEDVGRAHLIRTLRSPARLAHDLGPRLTVCLHGACVGAGIEVPAAAARVVAASDAAFRLPEVGMGLVPGAGGTASIPRRIGRRRACWLAISGATLDARTALAWGLVDEIAP
jgi:enoyl-CoA hydratase/carnithine racemase